MRRCINFENKIYLVLRWLAKYEKYSTLCHHFGCSNFVISKVIQETLPILCVSLIKHIPNQLISTKHSCLSKNIVAIIDGTIHRRLRPRFNQALYYRGDKGMHFIQTLLLVDFEGHILAFATNYPGSNADSSCARNAHLFKQILGSKFALGDTGFGNVSYIVTGLKKNQLKSDECRLYDRISRKEQKPIEWINNSIKRWRSLSNDSRFCQSTHLQTLSVGVVCSLYNIKKEFGFYDAEVWQNETLQNAQNSSVES